LEGLIGWDWGQKIPSSFLWFIPKLGGPSQKKFKEEGRPNFRILAKEGRRALKDYYLVLDWFRLSIKG